MTTDIQQGSDAAQAADTETTDTSQADPSAEVLAKARFEAFGLVTEARKEADSIIEEAKVEAAEIVREAEMTAESILDAARLQASDLRESDDASAVDDQSAALEAEHQELEERVGSLRDLADQLEERFAQLAAGAEPSPTSVPTADADDEASTAPVLDYSPSVQPDSKQEDESEEKPEEPSERGSFYSRRSAKLPRIGDESGKSALDMMRSIRSTLDDPS